MKDFKGTKGYYSVHHDDDETVIIAGKIGRYGEYTPVATIQQSGERGANDAKLLAAAPELLEALQALSHLCESRDWLMEEPEYKKAITAINKALGEEK